MSIINNFKKKLMSIFLKKLKNTPVIRNKIKKEFSEIMDGFKKTLKPYKDIYSGYKILPQAGISHNEVLNLMSEIQKHEEKKWKEGFVSGAVYHGDQTHIDFLNKVYSINSQCNPLHSDVWPSCGKFESEIVSMTSKMLGAKQLDSQICGTITSGGTESILLAMKAYRDRAKKEKGIINPEMIVPITAHAAFDKAAQYFNIKIIKIPVNKDFQVSTKDVLKAITKNTIVIAGSAPNFPNGIIDPIEELSEISYSKNIGFHTDACLGGFVLPWAKKLGYKIPNFDFSLRGVTSISVDTHKYGYALKGTSVILYQNHNLRHYQFFKIADWPGGLYFSPTFAGSKSGALSAACWAALVSIGENGYMDATKKILKTAEIIKKGIHDIQELRILGDPLWNISFTSDIVNIYQVLDIMSTKGWSLNGLHKPSCIHLCVTLRHTLPDVMDRFINDLKIAVLYAKEHPDEKGKMAPIYGMAATFPDGSMIEDMLDMYMDILYDVD